MKKSPKKRYAEKERMIIIDCFSSFAGYLVSFLNKRSGILRAENGGRYCHAKEYSQVYAFVEEDSDWNADTIEKMLWNTNFGRVNTYIGVVDFKEEEEE